MRLPFIDPPREEVALVASDLIVRFGLHARDEALHLAGLSKQMRARWNRQLYRQAAREIEMSFAEARKRLDVARRHGKLLSRGASFSDKLITIGFGVVRRFARGLRNLGDRLLTGHGI